MRRRLPEAVLIDIDGVLHVDGTLVPGAPPALERVRSLGVTIRLVTNTTRRARADVVRALLDLGFRVEPDEIMTAVRATGALLRSWGSPRCKVYSPRDLSDDLPGISIVETDPEVVVLGDLGHGFDYSSLNAIFREVLGGARLVAFQANRYWRSSEGLVLDAGPFVRAIEYAAGVEATVVGKPSRDFFLAAVRDAGADPGRSVMVGDDLESDVGGARAAGLVGVLVRTGKFSERALETTAAPPDRVLDSIADLPGVLDDLLP